MALSLRGGVSRRRCSGSSLGHFIALDRWLRRRVVVGLENALRSCEESPTHELGSALHQAHAVSMHQKPEDPAVLVPSTQ